MDQILFNTINKLIKQNHFPSVQQNQASAEAEAEFPAVLMQRLPDGVTANC